MFIGFNIKNKSLIRYKMQTSFMINWWCPKVESRVYHLFKCWRRQVMSAIFSGKELEWLQTCRPIFRFLVCRRVCKTMWCNLVSFHSQILLKTCHFFTVLLFLILFLNPNQSQTMIQFDLRGCLLVLWVSSFLLYRPVGMPKMEKVYLHNPSSEEISLISISATTAHFHASFFQNRVSTCSPKIILPHTETIS